MNYRALVVGGLLSALLLTGCGKKKVPPPDPVEVSGTATGLLVSADGRNIALLLVPEEDIGSNKKPVFSVDATTGAFSGKAVPGNYKVTVVVPTRHGHGGATGPTEVGPTKDGPGVPDRLLDPARTPLRLKIPEGGSTTLTLKIPTE